MPLKLFDKRLRLPTGVVYVQVTRTVESGQEFFLDYGSIYWADRAEGLKRLIVDYL